MPTKVIAFTALFFLGILPGCTPFKLNTCTQVPQIVDRVEALAPYAGKQVCAGASIELSMPQ